MRPEPHHEGEVMSNTIMPIFIPTPPPSREPVDPKCPHCKKKLKGWTKPSSKEDLTFGEMVVGISLLILIAVNGIGAFVSGLNAPFDPCDRKP